MRACFLGQNICALGFGVATLQAPPLVMDTPIRDEAANAPACPNETLEPSPDQPSFVTNPQRLSA
jgi:hypothetical protein